MTVAEPPAGPRRGRSCWPWPCSGRPGGCGGSALIAIVGPTASGKSALALRLARRARRRDRLLRQPAGLPRARHRQRQAHARRSGRAVPHHLLDVVDPDQDFSAADYARLARAALADIRGRGRAAHRGRGHRPLPARAAHGLVRGAGPRRGPAARGWRRSPSGGGDARLHRLLRARGPRGGRAHRAARPRARGARARGLPRDRPRRSAQHHREGARAAARASACASSAWRRRATALRAAVERRTARDARSAGCSRRCAACSRAATTGACARCRRSAIGRRSRRARRGDGRRGAA